MKDQIRLLPDSVANQIAAGEVIQRPASVLKELVENAVDAGADDIKIIIRDAGRTLIQVIDNGCGLSETDARMAFERHATSKISSADDLFSLHTMGFRGEALPSICAVSRVELRSRREDMAVGTHLVINGSKVEFQKQDVCDKGTNIMVKNLFFNVPARRKFLKSDNIELSNLMREFERLALVNTKVRLSIDTGGKKIELKKATFRQRIADLWQNNMTRQLLPVEADTSIVKISGFISRPEHARRRNALQYFIVNGRNMKHPYFHRAVVNCFNSLIASDTLPSYFIRFDVDPASIDVNIHPTKNEIKFEEEGQIWSILSAAVKASLGKNAAVPSIDFDFDALSVDPLQPGDEVAKPEIYVPTDYNPFAIDTPSEDGRRHRRDEKPDVKGWENLYEGFMSKKGETSIARDFGPASDSPEINNEAADTLFSVDFPANLCLQINDKYIVSSYANGMIIIDQHRAHLKILYERFLKQSESGSGVSQAVLFPESIEISDSQSHLFDEVKTQLSALGFMFDNVGGKEYTVVGIPAGCSSVDANDIIFRVMESIGDDTANYGNDGLSDLSAVIRRKAAYLMARSSAIVRGRKLQPEEMEKIIGELFQLSDPVFTPTGKRIFSILDDDAMARLIVQPL